MGMVKYVKRGEEATVVEADFPLHPGLVNFTTADGNTVQLPREAFDQQYTQKLPDLPPVDPSVLDETTAVKPPRDMPLYESPTVKQLATPSTVPQSHHAWFALIFDKIKALEAKLEQVVVDHPALKVAVDHIEQMAVSWAEKKLGVDEPKDDATQV